VRSQAAGESGIALAALRDTQLLDPVFADLSALVLTVRRPNWSQS